MITGLAFSLSAVCLQLRSGPLVLVFCSGLFVWSLVWSCTLISGKLPAAMSRAGERLFRAVEKSFVSLSPSFLFLFTHNYIQDEERQLGRCSSRARVTGPGRC